MRIGLFLNNLDEEYQLSAYKGIKAEAAACGLELICVQGESLPPKSQIPPNNREPPVLFPSRNILGADGILFLSSVLFNRSISEYEEQFNDMFKNVPFVSVGDAFFDFHCILIQNEKPMRDLMEHLLAFHKFKKLLFIGGPAEHTDNIVREKIFNAAIEQHRANNPILQGTVIHGDFTEITGMNITRNYMNENPDNPPDVIVAANDTMAIGARNFLLTREDPRWNKCPVTGFDDISQSGLEIPTLTTVKQPLDELGKLAVRTLLDIIQGKDAPKTTAVEAKLIIRNSCGCPIKTEQKAANLVQYRSIYHLRYLSVLGKSLTAINTFEEMFNPLRSFISNLDVPFFFLIAYDRPMLEIGTEGNLIYERSLEKESFGFKDAPRINIKEFFLKLGSYPGASGVWCLRYLRSGNEYLGLVIYEAGDLIHPQLCNGFILLSNTMNRLFGYQDGMDREAWLNREVAFRTSDLLEENKKLREEIQRLRESSRSQINSAM